MPIHISKSKEKFFMCTYERRGKYGISSPKCPHSTEEGCSYLCAGFNTFTLCKCTGLHVYMFNNGTSCYAMEFVLARFLSFSPM